MLNKKIIIPILICCTISVFWSCVSSGSTTKHLFFQAETCYKELQSSPEKQKYRSYWFGCIRKFETVYQQDRSGPWAAAGLYNMGKLYGELYTHSYKEEDKRKAKELYTQIVNKYPASGYNAKAANALKKLPDFTLKQSRKGAAKSTYFEAEALYAELIASPGKQKFRSHWMECIARFEDVYEINPSGPWAAAGLFNMGQLYEALHKQSAKEDDKRKAKNIFEKIVNNYSDSAYSQRAKAKLQSDIKSLILISDKTIEKKPSKKKNGKVIKQTRRSSKSGLATVTGIRYWSNPEYTRVVIDVDNEISFQNNLLKKDPKIAKTHQRLYVDLKNCRLGDLKKTIPINDSLLKATRAGQFSSDTVRVVIDIKSFENYNIFSLNNPFRIVIDVRGKSTEKIPSIGRDGTGHASIAKQLALGVRRIVIDPGHGGKDYGAPGYLKGVHEKKVVLQIAKRLAQKIKQDLGCEAILTRNGDKYLTLEERTAIANTKKADLFISIHANASRNKRASGIETYFLNLTTDDESISVAARENATSEKNISELQTILNDLMQNAKINESSRLATYVQKALYKNIKKKYSRINNKGVKRAPFYVLIGAQMPAILIETSFISNKTECSRLTDRKYQERLCDGIVNGIRRYIEETRPAASIGMPSHDGG